MGYLRFDNPHRYLPEGNPGSADIANIQFTNVSIRCSRTPIRLMVEAGISLVRLSDIGFSDFRIESGDPCLVQGSPETTIRNVRFTNMQVDTSGEDAILCRYCAGVQLTNVILSNRSAGQGVPG